MAASVVCGKGGKRRICRVYRDETCPGDCLRNCFRHYHCYRNDNSCNSACDRRCGRWYCCRQERADVECGDYNVGGCGRMYLLRAAFLSHCVDHCSSGRVFSSLLHTLSSFALSGTRCFVAPSSACSSIASSTVYPAPVLAAGA